MWGEVGVDLLRTDHGSLFGDAAASVAYFVSAFLVLLVLTVQHYHVNRTEIRGFTRDRHDGKDMKSVPFFQRGRFSVERYACHGACRAVRASAALPSCFKRQIHRSGSFLEYIPAVVCASLARPEALESSPLPPSFASAFLSISHRLTSSLPLASSVHYPVLVLAQTYLVPWSHDRLLQQTSSESITASASLLHHLIPTSHNPS